MTTVAKHVDGTDMQPPRIPPKTTPEQRDRARRYVAGNAKDAGDCAVLLDMLGLGPVDGRWT